MSNRPRLSFKVGLVIGGSLIAVVAALFIGTALLAPRGDGPGPTAEPALPDAAACPIPAGLGASVRLAESTGGDDPNASGGRLVICDRKGVVVGATSTMVCEWAADRRHLRVVSGAVGPEPNQTGVSVQFEGARPADLTVSRGDVSYRSDDPRLVGGSAPGSPDGVLGFRDLPAAIDSWATPGPAPDPATTAGIIRWACDEPPAAVAGEAVGRIQLDIDGLPAAPRVAEATCRWVDLDGTPVMFGVETYSNALRLDGRETGLVIGRDALGEADPPRFEIVVSDPNQGGVNVSGEWLWPLALARDQSSGTLRFRAFLPDEGTPPDAVPAVKSGLVSWTCERPLAAPKPAPAGYEPHDVLPTRAGVGSIRLGSPVDVDLPAQLTCTILEPDPANPDPGLTTPQIQAITMTATFQGERLTLISSLPGPVVLERISAGGQLLGEYVGSELGTWGAQDADKGPHEVSFGSFTFEATDPRYVPLGGAGGPASVPVTVTVDCRTP